MRPWPEAFTTWTRSGKPPVKITLKKVSIAADATGAPGTTSKLSDGTLAVKCGDGSLLLQVIQAEGKNATDAKSYLNGHPDFADARLQ